MSITMRSSPTQGTVANGDAFTGNDIKVMYISKDELFALLIFYTLDFKDPVARKCLSKDEDYFEKKKKVDSFLKN